ncbi:unnamed protein product [Tuber melanosporum]|uniref:(Perigord truffle) hypothetical protein n=1 Tax=Tuber melanosporum (strain Mel28) TaxID=656061 RepID=D5GHI3_TUBMM|nr:uncharacterized protein GSTUM_00007930001 [Tuber melanosporum]CAZ83976.1 unnamed protein product [Tuber melanosporum]
MESNPPFATFLRGDPPQCQSFAMLCHHSPKHHHHPLSSLSYSYCTSSAARAPILVLFYRTFALFRDVLLVHASCLSRHPQETRRDWRKCAGCFGSCKLWLRELKMLWKCPRQGLHDAQPPPWLLLVPVQYSTVLYSSTGTVT